MAIIDPTHIDRRVVGTDRRRAPEQRQRRWARRCSWRADRSGARMTACYSMSWDLTPSTRRGTTLGRRLVTRHHYAGAADGVTKRGSDGPAWSSQVDVEAMSRVVEQANATGCRLGSPSPGWPCGVPQPGPCSRRRCRACDEPLESAGADSASSDVRCRVGAGRRGAALPRRRARP